MTQLMVDTSAYAAFKRGHASVVHLLKRSAEILLPTIVLGELWARFEAGTRREQNRLELEAFLQSPRVVVAPIGEETAMRYAMIYAHLRTVGRPIPTNDLWIAASAMEQGTVLLTADAHFLLVPQILVEHISPGDE